MALRSDKRAGAAYFDALFGAFLPSLPSTTHGVYQVTTATDDKPPEDHPALWKASTPRSSCFRAEEIKDCTFIHCCANTKHYTIAMLLNGTRCCALID